MKSITIDDQTHVPLKWVVGVALTLLTTGGGGVFWLSTMYSDLAQAKREIASQKEDQKETVKTLRRMERALLKVQIKMGIEPEIQPNDDKF